MWDVPRSTHTYLVEHVLGLGLPSVRHRLICQYIGYFRKLRDSASKEVRVLCQIVARDAQAATGRNLLKIQEEYDLDPWSSSVSSFKMKDIRNPIPEADAWRTELLKKLLLQKYEIVVKIAQKSPN